LKSIEENSKKVIKIQQIFDTYLNINSAVEVNVDAQTRRLLEERIKTLSVNDEKLDFFFEEVRLEVEKNMRDSMNRFLFSEEFLSLKIGVKIDADNVIEMKHHVKEVESLSNRSATSDKSEKEK
jgi:hypothetical protein